MFYKGDINIILPTLKKYQMIMTSPPYWKGFEYDSFNSYKQYLDWCETWIKQLKNNLDDNGYFFLNIANDTETPIKAFELMNICLKYFRLIDTIIWYCYNRQPHNTNRSLTNQTEYIFLFRHNTANINLNKSLVLEKYPDVFDTKNVGNVWKIPFKSSKKTKLKKSIGKWGSSGYPEKLVEICILLTTNEGDNILDCFCGTQTLLDVGFKLNRIADGIDLIDYKI
jgi:DNA modification methylase